MANSADPDQTRSSPIRGAVPLEELSGSGCSNLTMLLVNERLEFQTMPKNVRSFCSAKASLIFSTKNIRFFVEKM